MSGYIHVITKEKAVRLQSLKDDLIARRDKNFFWPTGTQVYCGVQGSGKTVSAVKHVHELKFRYPKAILVSNLDLQYFEPLDFSTKEELKQLLKEIDTDSQYIRFQSMDELSIALVEVNNGKFGVIYLIDEIHTYFNSVAEGGSKNIPMFIFTEISQQRKQRKCIIGTSQIFDRMAKPFREQCDNLIVCRTFFGVLTIQTAYDGMDLSKDYDGKYIGHKRKRGWFWHTRRIRNAYDTFQKVVSASEQYEAINRTQIIGRRGRSVEIRS